MGNKQPIICQREEHNISRRDIDPDALKVLYRLARHNYIAYLVGGGVRDLLLGRIPKDFDVSTDASPNQIKKLFKNCFLIGRRFRLAHIKYGEKIIETSTFRKQPEPANGELLQLNDNEFGTPEEDAERRDFTINGLFYNVENFCIIDYVGGLKDLKKRVIRAIGDPEIRFQEDPVRMIRAIRFASRLEFEIEPTTFKAIKNYASELEKASPPRMLEEIYRLFAFNSAARAIKLLYESSLLHVISPEVTAYISKTINNGAEPLIWSYLEALDQGDVIATSIDNSLMLACVFFPAMLAHIDKPASTMTQKSLLESFSRIVIPFLERYRVPRRTKDRLSKILTMQHRFMVKGRKGFNKSRFVSLSWFLDALALHELYLTATGRDFTRADEWRKLWELRQEEIENQSTEIQKSSRRRNSRRRRNNRKRSKKNRNNTTPSGSTTDSNAQVSTTPAVTQEKPSESSKHSNTKKLSSTSTTIQHPITPMSILKQSSQHEKKEL